MSNGRTAGFRKRLSYLSKIPHIDPTLQGELVRSLSEFARGDFPTAAAQE